MFKQLTRVEIQTN